MKKFIIFFVFILGIFQCSFSQEDSTINDIKTIFILHSYNQSLKWQIDQEVGYAPYLFKENYELIMEYLDSKRYPLNEVRENLFLEKFIKLYTDKNFDLIILTDNAALRFINKYYHRLPFLENTPIIINGINYLDSSLISNIPDCKIIPEFIKSNETVLQILSFFPETKQIFVINDYSSTGISWKKDISSRLPEIEGSLNDVQIIYNKNTTFKKLINKIKSLPQNSAILIGNYFLDTNRTYIPTSVFLSALRNATELPVFCLNDYMMDSATVIGGMVNSGINQGRQLGIEAEKALNPNYKIQSKNEPFWLFNYLALEKHDLLDKPLPKGAIVLNTPKKFFSEHKTFFVTLLILAIIGLISLLIFIYLNYTLRKKVSHRTERIKEWIQKFEQFTMEMPIGYVEFDINYKITSWNKCSEKIFGYTRKEAIGEKILNLIVPEEEQTHVKTLLDSLINGETNFFSQNSNITKTGDIIQCEWFNTPLKDKEGNIYCFMSMLIDVSEREKLRKDVEFMIEELKRMILQKDKFIASSMHDLKNLMTPILCYSELINMKNIDPEKIKSMAEQINKSSTILLDLMNKVMNISRAQSGLMKYEPRKIRIHNVVSEMLSALELNYRQKNITVSNSIDPDILVMADHEMVGSILLNLLGNAIKFTPENGSIAVSGKVIRKKLEIRVKDSGIGIDLEKFNNLIENNVSFSSKGTAGESGTGLGLQLCNELIEKNFGSFRAEHNADGGTSFFFTLPIADA